MNILQALIMGFIQGATEFLPVSSSGHLAIFKLIFGANLESGILFDVLLHVGTLVSIFVAFRHDIWELILAGLGILKDLIGNVIVFVKSRTSGDDDEFYAEILSTPHRRFAMLIIVATIPTGILGFVGKDFVESASATLLIPGICLIITGILLFIADRVEGGKTTAKNATFLSAFEIGIAQGVATLPGLSRSGTTITACLLCGFSKSFAVKFSFIMSIPAVLGAAVLELDDIGSLSLGASEWGCYLAGMVVAAVVGFICIQTVMLVVRKQKFTIFSIYCIAVGILSVSMYFVRR